MFWGHGDYALKVDRDVIHVDVNGSCNEVTIHAMVDEIIKQVSEKIDLKNHWAILLNTENWKLSTPDASKWIIKLKKWADDNGQTHEAIINEEISIKKMQLDEYFDVSGSKVIHKYFTNEKDAEKWLREKGFFKG